VFTEARWTQRVEEGRQQEVKKYRNKKNSISTIRQIRKRERLETGGSALGEEWTNTEGEVEK